MKKNKRILLDMSTTLIHHGHIRLINKANKFGDVIVALTKDAEIKKYKGYKPELDFKYRKEAYELICECNRVLQLINNIIRAKVKKDKLEETYSKFQKKWDSLKEIDRQKMIKKFSDEIFDTIKDRNSNNLIND